MLFSSDATIEVIKKTDSLATLAIEDSSESGDDAIKATFFKSVVTDMNVLATFNVDKTYRKIAYNSTYVAIENRDMDYVLRYRLIDGDSSALNMEMKLFNKGNLVFSKNYYAKSSKIFIFLVHSMAYDINKLINKSSLEWIKRKVIFSRIVAPKKSEIIIADYTLAYQQAVIKGGLNLFPKWANREQTSIYYSSLDEDKPTLKYLEITTGKNKTVISSDGMMICSDVSSDEKRLLLTMAPNGQPDVYLYGVDTKKIENLTKYGGIDVNGQFLGENAIVFVSDRLGYPNIFSKKNNSENIEQLVFQGKNNSACSAFDKYIVYKARESSTAFTDNTFNLHLISTDTDSVKRLTSVGINEFPKFSIDGDAIIFIKNYQGQSSIGIIRMNNDMNFLFPLKYGKIQSMDW